MERVAVPFRLDRYVLDLKSSVTQHGVLRLEADALVIEFRETTTNLSSLTEKTGDVRTARIPLADLDTVELEKAWPRRVRLRIRTRTLAALEKVPGVMGNECVLPIRRRDRTKARELAVAVALALSGLELKRIEDGDG